MVNRTADKRRLVWTKGVDTGHRPQKVSIEVRDVTKELITYRNQCGELVSLICHPNGET
jgi:hypothetical protein